MKPPSMVYFFWVFFSTQLIFAAQLSPKVFLSNDMQITKSEYGSVGLQLSNQDFGQYPRCTVFISSEQNIEQPIYSPTPFSIVNPEQDIVRSEGRSMHPLNPVYQRSIFITARANDDLKIQINCSDESLFKGRVSALGVDEINGLIEGIARIQP